MKNLLLALLLVAISTPLYAVFTLRVGDPRVSGSTQQGTIEEAVLSVRPKGLYLEYGLYLTFSARGTSYKASDSLEVTLKFDLPAGAIVHDSWLWIWDEIVRALILDRWTASSIYEGIVQRRQDPSILVKNSATQYELRVFPMRGDERRKVKITYLMPADWNHETVEADLPMDILKTSKNQLTNFPILTWPDADWQNPVIVDRADLVFSEKNDTLFGQYYATELSAANQQIGLRFAFDSPLKKGHFVRMHASGQSGVYQLAILPSQLFEYESKRKILLVVDYNKDDNNAISSATLLQAFRDRFHREFTPQDSFNILLSDLDPKTVSSTWLPADSLSIATAFGAAGALLADYSTLPLTLAAGIDFVKMNGHDGSILLATNNNQYGSISATNPLIADIMALVGDPPFPIHTLNFHNSGPGYAFGGNVYNGSDYLLINLAKLTGGVFTKVLGSTLAAATTAAVASTGPALRSYDLHTTLENGYCYGRFELNTTPDAAFLNKPILQIGKFNGSLPFKIQLAGELENQFVAAEVVQNAGEIGPADSLTREMWYGSYIRLLETGTPSNTTISDIVYNSIAERVLSRYTAFLCLEDPAQICPTCEDETQLVGTTEAAPADSLLRAWPNPFSERVTIEIRAAANESFSPSAVLEIYKTDGQLVRQFQLTEIQNGTATVVWDGRDGSANTVPAGAYIALARINSGHSRVLKLVK
jgi:Ca-activated chloride channel family protein